MRNCSRMTIAVLGLLCSASAMALESGFYIGAVGGQTSVDVDESVPSGPLTSGVSYSVDDSDSGFGIVVGGQFGRWLAVETQIIDLGEYREQVGYTVTNFFSSAPRNLDVRGSSSTEAAAVTLSGIVSVPIGEYLAIGFRLGVAVSAAETNYEFVERRGNSIYYSESDSNDAQASDINATYGLSFEWDPTRHFGFRLEYQLFKNVGAEDDDYDYDEDDDEEEHAGADVGLISMSLIGRF